MRNYNFLCKYVLISTILLFVSCSTKAEQPATLEPVVAAAKPLGELNSTKKFSTLDVEAFKESDLSKYQEIIQKNLVIKVSDEVLRQEITTGILKAAKTYHLNPIFLLAIAEATSNLKPDFIGNDRFGFIPLNQAKANYISKLYNIPLSDPAELQNFSKNLELAGAYFGFVGELYQNNYEHYVLAYNWNAEALSVFLKSRTGLPKEHQKLLSQVAKVYQSYFQEQKLGTTPIEKSAGTTDRKTVENPEVPKASDPVATKEVELSQVDPIIKTDSTKSLPEYYLTTKTKKSSNEYYQKLLSLTLAEKINLTNPQIILKAIVAKSMEANIDPVFVFSFIKNSSNFNEQLSINNKFGILQISLEDAELAANFIGQPWTGKDSLYVVEQNLALGLGYLKICHNIFDNNSFQALAGYRWGIKNLILALKNKSDIPPLVIRYPQIILEEYQTYKGELNNPKQNKLAETGDRKNITLAVEPLQKFICHSTQELDLCTKLTNLIKKESGYYQVTPMTLAKYAQLQSNFKVDLQANGRFGLFQWSASEAEKIAEYAKVAWAGPKELLKPEYSIKIAAKYYNYLEQRFKGNKKYIALALFWDVDLLTKTISSKGAIPNDVNSKATQLLQ